MINKDYDSNQLAHDIKQLAKQLGFSLVGICNTDLTNESEHLDQYLNTGKHATMNYLQQHNQLRLHPEQLMPGVKSIICCAINYWPDAANAQDVLNNRNKAYVSRYSLGRDYHKLMRKRLEKLAKKITEKIGDFNYRCFTDSAPVLEKALAIKAGLGWQGKNSLLLNAKHGSWFFLGEIYTDLELPIDQPQNNHCGNCQRCIEQCPTKAIIAPYIIDAKRCISYLTLEYKGVIPIELQPLIGNRIYGCDDCQLVCPWNKFAQHTQESDFNPRHNLDYAELSELSSWSEQDFLTKTAGSAIRRIGYERWKRNIAIAIDNSTKGLLKLI